jgi:hypothetical protein
MPDEIRDASHGFPKNGRSAGVDHRDPDAHRAAVSDKGSAQLKAPRKVPYPSFVGPLRTIGDK